jgi:hypothetical protein
MNCTKETIEKIAYEVNKVLRKKKNKMDLKIHSPFHNDKIYDGLYKSLSIDRGTDTIEHRKVENIPIVAVEWVDGWSDVDRGWIIIDLSGSAQGEASSLTLRCQEQVNILSNLNKELKKERKYVK